MLHVQGGQWVMNQIVRVCRCRNYTSTAHHTHQLVHGLRVGSLRVCHSISSVLIAQTGSVRFNLEADDFPIGKPEMKERGQDRLYIAMPSRKNHRLEAEPLHHSIKVGLSLSSSPACKPPRRLT